MPTRFVNRVGRPTFWILIPACLAVMMMTFWVRDFDGDPVLRAALPDPDPSDDYVTSSTCRSCHPGAYHSWHDSYHRTMTQAASSVAVVGDFDAGSLEKDGYRWAVERRGEEFWVDMIDPLWLADHPFGTKNPGEPRRFQARVVMTTGSHHLQNYWVRRPKDKGAYSRPDAGELLQFPWVWMVKAGRWVPTKDSFLAPPSRDYGNLMSWNTSCNMCHSVGTQPGIQKQKFETATAELGIACEACHGPAEEHVRYHSSPVQRYLSHFDEDGPDPTIVNPARLDKERSAEVCGQCHSFNKELDMKRWKETGVAYRPGDVLGETKAVFKFTENPTHPRLLEHLKAEPDAVQSRFWADGTMRVAGREYNGLIESACYLKGEMTCLSCHSMHGFAEPKDQLAPDRLDDASCLQCHKDMGNDIAAHTHHAVDSPGSRCMNCHMPHTTFGLLEALRSHRIDNPSAAVTAKTGRPNACNICHLDKTLEWTAKTLTEWYGYPEVELTNRQRKVAASIVWVTKGNAAQRAIGAWAMGWEPAQRASGKKWQGAFLAQLLDDPYSVVRYVARQSLGTLAGFDGFRYDYVAPQEELVKGLDEALGRWRKNGGLAPDRHGTHMLMDERGKIDVERYNRLRKFRDTTPMRIIE